LFSSFFDPVLSELRRLAPNLRIALLVEPRHQQGWLERARAVAAEAVNPWFGLATPEFVATAHAAGLAVYPYTVDDEDVIRRLLDAGVDGLFTNHPARMRGLLPCPLGGAALIPDRI
jgi:glycerophosphoryl diester phosphodiesterase